MFTALFLIGLLVLAAVAGGFHSWAQNQGLLTAGQAAESEQGAQGTSLLTEAAAYRFRRQHGRLKLPAVRRAVSWSRSLTALTTRNGGIG